jgi:protoporphyrinogen oxidase
MSDEDMLHFGSAELKKIGLAEAQSVRDGVVVKMPFAYPSYTGTYERLETIREYLSRFDNLYPVGRNGQHRYNNMDHSMLSAMVAVDHIRGIIADKQSIWAVNTEEEYHERK